MKRPPASSWHGIHGCSSIVRAPRSGGARWVETTTIRSLKRSSSRSRTRAPCVSSRCSVGSSSSMSGLVDSQARARLIGSELQSDDLLAAVGKRLGQFHDARKHIRETLDAPGIAHQLLAGLGLVPLRRFGEHLELLGVERSAYAAMPRLARSAEHRDACRVNILAHEGTPIVFLSASNARSVAVRLKPAGRPGPYFILRPRPMDLASFERVAE